MTSSAKSLLLLGATGLVGQQVLNLALSNPTVTKVTAPTRRSLPAHHKLLNPVVDFTQLPAKADWWHADAVICALGTTRKLAGSAAAFRAVDYDLVLNAAKSVYASGARTFVLNSSLGANSKATGLYLQVKGEIERDIEALGFESLVIVRPSLLDGGFRPDRRRAEEIGITLSKLFKPLIPKRYRAITTHAVAQCMLAQALTAVPGVHIIESDAISHNT